MSQRETLFIENITVPAHRARGLNPEAVERLKGSIERLGLQTPISVRYDAETGDVLLVAGLHRMEACRALGMDTIPAIYTEGTADEARMWELAENLHRADLTAVERAEHIKEWDTLKVRNNSALSTGRGNEGGYRQTARELGVDEKTVRNAAKIADLPQEVKDQAIAEKWSQTKALEATRNGHGIGTITAAPHKPAPAIKNAFESEEDWRRSLFTVWNRGAQDWRERALEYIDQPVMDRG